MQRYWIKLEVTPMCKGILIYLNVTPRCTVLGGSLGVPRCCHWVYCVLQEHYETDYVKVLIITNLRQRQKSA